MTATDFAAFRIALRPASSSTRYFRHSLMLPTFSRPAHHSKNLRPEGLDAPAADPFDASERLDVAGSRLGDRTHEPIRKHDTGLEPRRRRRVGPPLPQQLRSEEH